MSRYILLSIKTLSLLPLKTCGATRNPEFPRTGPDRTETGLGSGNIFKNIFGPGRVGEFYFGSVRVGEFYFGSVRVGVFFTGVWDIFSRDLGDKLPFHSQTEEVAVIILDKHIVWCYNFIAGHIHVFIVVWNLSWSLNLWSQHKIFSIPQNFRVGSGRNLLISGWC